MYRLKRFMTIVVAGVAICGLRAGFSASPAVAQCTQHTCDCLLYDSGVGLGSGGGCLTSIAYTILNASPGCCNTISGCSVAVSCGYDIRFTPACSADPCPVFIKYGTSQSGNCYPIQNCAPCTEANNIAVCGQTDEWNVFQSGPNPIAQITVECRNCPP
jgi:hypothetical protein